ncbi:MAG: aspartyl protease family protein [Bacteroidota bacterium]
MLCFFYLTVNAQYFTLDGGRSKSIPFELVRNLIVIKVNINNKGPYNFVLDTGVGFMLITDPTLLDSIKIPNKRSIKINGFGDGPAFEAYLTPPLKVDIAGLISNNVSAAIFKKDAFGLSNYSGIPIHGLIGYEFFSRLAVKISFSDTTMRVSLPKDMRFYKKGSKIPLSIEDKKPYLTTKVVFADGSEKQNKLIVDLGAGHFISMEGLENKAAIQKKFINANLGMGINGLISGTLSRVKEVELGAYRVKNVIAAFPEDEARTRALTVPRDGNLGIGLLKKFDLIIDYPDSVIYLKPGPNYRKTEEHDMSGLVYFADVLDDFQHIIIYQIEPESAGETAGLQPNDEIVAINFKPVSPLSMQQIDDLFRSSDGRLLILGIFRNKKYINVLLTLKRRI